jgi:hypothetical protein
LLLFKGNFLRTAEGIPQGEPSLDTALRNKKAGTGISIISF